MDAVMVDPLNPCPPLGAMYASLGIHGCLPLSHGASGCCRFQRMEIAKHFQRTLHVPSTMLRDDAAVFGGTANIEEAVANVFELYDPDIVVLHSTCLSETIGDDIEGICNNLVIPDGKQVVWARTPGYAGSHLLGYSQTVKALIEQLGNGRLKARGCGLGLIPGWVNPVDVEVLKLYAAAFFSDVVTVPDVCRVLDWKPSDNPRRYAPGGTHRCDLERISMMGACIAVGREATNEPAWALARLAGIIEATKVLSLPVGIRATDVFVGALVNVSGEKAPDWLMNDRRNAVDCLIKTAGEVSGTSAAVVCDADMALGVASFLVDVGMKPGLVAVGHCRPDFEEVLRSEVDLPLDCKVMTGADRLDVEDWLQEHPVDLVLGDTRNKRMAARLDVPLVRVGFPVVDRPLQYNQSVVGYRASTDLLRRIVEALYEHTEKVQTPEELVVSRYF